MRVDQRGDVLLVPQVEGGQRLVAQQQPRVGGQRLGRPGRAAPRRRTACEIGASPKPAAPTEASSVVDPRPVPAPAGAAGERESPAVPVDAHPRPRRGPCSIAIASMADPLRDVADVGAAPARSVGPGSSPTPRSAAARRAARGAGWSCRSRWSRARRRTRPGSTSRSRPAPQLPVRRRPGSRRAAAARGVRSAPDAPASHRARRGERTASRRRRRASPVQRLASWPSTLSFIQLQVVLAVGQRLRSPGPPRCRRRVAAASTASVCGPLVCSL